MTLSLTFSFFSSRPGKVRSKVVPLKGSIKEPNLPFKSCDGPFLQEPNITWGSGGISSMWRFPVSSTFWTFQNNNTTNFIIISPLILFILPEPLLFLSWAPFDFLTCAPSDFGGKTRQAFPAPSHPSSSNIFHLGNHIFFHSQIIKLLTWGQTGEVPSPQEPPPCCPASRASPPWTKVFHIKNSIDYKACCHVCHLVAGLGTTGSGTGSSTSPSSQQSS